MATKRTRTARKAPAAQTPSLDVRAHNAGVDLGVKVGGYTKIAAETAVHATKRTGQVSGQFGLGFLRGLRAGFAA